MTLRMTFKGLARRAAGRRRRLPAVSRRGVVSVLAMMFVVLFGSLSVAMAIASRGNLRAAQTHLHVTRALSAAETGLAVAEKRLHDAVRRFVVSKGEVDSDFAWRLWTGQTSAGDGTVECLPPPSGHPEDGLPAGIAMALVHAHAADQNVVPIGGVSEGAGLASAPAGTDLDEYRGSYWVKTPAVAVDGSADDLSAGPAAYQIVYAPLANGTDIRVIVTGYSSVTELGSGYHYRPGKPSDDNPLERRYRPLSRTVQQDFRIVKRHEHAVLSPSRIMFGKNVSITGKIGARYTDVAQENGHPVTIRSDFRGLDPVLDNKLQAFFDRLAESDIDGDNRLRIGHAVEGAGIPPSQDFDGDGVVDAAYEDATGDGFLDELDIFINHFDKNGDRRVTLSAALTAGTPAEGQSPEFTLDDDLALLLDSANPDRNRNGVSGFIDTNKNGRWDPGEELRDYDPRNNVYPDRVLGYRDGYIDRMDQYAKVRGRMVFQVTQQEWANAHADYRDQLRGTFVPPAGESALQFGGTEEDLPMVTAASFETSQTPLQAAADGAPFATQVALQLGISTTLLETYVEEKTDASAPRYWRADLDDSYVFARTGRHLYEKMPFDSPSHSDWYYRPRFENMVFRNVQIPRGTNALFINCTFIGVTYVRSYTNNTHPNWALYGKMEWDETVGRPVPVTDPLDKSDFLRYYNGNPADGPANYDQFPDPPVIDGEVIPRGQDLSLPDRRNTKLYSNNIRFHDCLFVGSIVSDTPQEYWHVRNKLQFTGSTRFTTEHPDEPENPELNPDPTDLNEILKSSMMLPNYSVDIGSFNSPTDTFSPLIKGQNVNLQGTIVAGVLDIRGNANVDGTLLLTFAPVAGEGPLQQNGQAVGNPAGFNTSIGYFGPEDGDGESLDPETLPLFNGQRIVGWDTDGDGIADVPPDQPQPPGGSPVPFYGYGRINLNWNPDLPMPDGIKLPLSLRSLGSTYREGRR